jgi:hypothetical protein
MARRQRRMRTVDDDGERKRVYIGSRGGAWWLQNEISIAFTEIEQERGLIEFWLELVLSIVDAMRWARLPPPEGPFAYTSYTYRLNIYILRQIMTRSRLDGSLSLCVVPISNRDKVIAIATAGTNDVTAERGRVWRTHSNWNRKVTPMIIDKNEAIGRSENV